MQLQFFSSHEFQGWFNRTSPKMLSRMDLFRYRWGKRIDVSPVTGAVGREGTGGSQHYYEPHKEIRAIDLFPQGLATQQDAYRALKIAIECGFTGIGLYPHWRPSTGLHLDVREDVSMGRPALWGAQRPDRAEPQRYISFDDAVAWLPEAR